MTIAKITTSKNRTLTVTRTGKRIDQGGDGVKWKCTCGKSTTCWHLIGLWRGMFNAKAVTLTAAGKRLFNKEAK